MSAHEIALLFANDIFYTAFSEGDLEVMSDIWAQDTPVTCIHPGSPVIAGRDAVLDSWRPILESGQTHGFTCEHPQAYIHGDMGWVTCLERLGDGALAATNIFVRENGTWKMVHHQAGPTSAPPSKNHEQNAPASRIH